MSTYDSNLKERIEEILVKGILDIANSELEKNSEKLMELSKDQQAGELQKFIREILLGDEDKYIMERIALEKQLEELTDESRKEALGAYFKMLL